MQRRQILTHKAQQVKSLSLPHIVHEYVGEVNRLSFEVRLPGSEGGVCFDWENIVVLTLWIIDGLGVYLQCFELFSHCVQ